HLRELVGAFCAVGATITVASPRVRPEGDELGSEAELVEIEPVLPRSYPTLAALRRAVALQAGQVESIARERRADAVYERLSLFGESGLRAARRLGLPHVLELNAPLYEEALRFRSLPFAAAAEQIERDVCAGTDHAFAVSATLAERLPHGKVSVAPNGIDPAKFAAPRRRHEGFTVGFAGSLKPWHGVGVLLEAFALALERDPALRLEIVGTGPEAAACEHAGRPSH